MGAPRPRWPSPELTLSWRTACPQRQVRERGGRGRAGTRQLHVWDRAATARAPSPWARPAPGRVGTSVLRDQDAWSSQRPPFGDAAPPSAVGEASRDLCGLGGPRGEPQLACLSCLSPTPFLLCLSLQISGEQPTAWPRACPSSLWLASAASTVSAR